ncbi:hypothetical protein UFOVP674_31 [uncultured Caudovirales phage]|uniref:Uncharacterized protein n=1 Tax=uncultured Caudovirales phage TaxID=2100421 RepID=A0A6J5NAZ4_9CAUD|nr:hypothetical protein UFOVP674_31 [uncultured Caudovirales phage]
MNNLSLGLALSLGASYVSSGTPPPPPGASTYLRPDGLSVYRRPDGTSSYFRP